MTNLIKIAACSVIALAATAATAQASSITSIAGAENGAVVIERAGTFQDAANGSAVVAADRVITLNEASANVALTSECSVLVNPNQVLNVLSTTASSCDAMFSLEALNASDLETIGSSNLAAVGASTILQLAAVAVVVVGGAIAFEDDNTVDSSVSP